MNLTDYQNQKPIKRLPIGSVGVKKEELFFYKETAVGEKVVALKLPKLQFYGVYIILPGQKTFCVNDENGKIIRKSCFFLID